MSEVHPDDLHIKVVEWVGGSWVLSLRDRVTGLSFGDKKKAEVVADWLRFAISQDGLIERIHGLKQPPAGRGPTTMRRG